MNRWQEQVLEFHEKMSQSVGFDEPPRLRDVILRTRLVKEECGELLEAIHNGDLVGAIDASCDLIYVVLGGMVSAGVDLDPFFDEVHATNMAKLDGPVDAFGKRLKPPGWKPPRIAALLEQQIKARGGR